METYMYLVLCSVTDNRAMPSTYCPIEFSPRTYAVGLLE